MTNNDFSDPTQFQLEDIKIDGIGVTGLFAGLSIYENIYIPAVTGTLMLFETDGGNFIEENEIEFIEDISFRFKNAKDEVLEFEGHLNGLQNESVKDSKKIYVIDFVSKAVRENEQTFIVKKFDDVAPEEIINEMLEDRLQAEEVDNMVTGKPMSFVGSRKKPLDIIKYVLTHGVAQDQNAPSAGFTESGEPQEDETSGFTGFLCWETTEGYRASSIQQLLNKEVGTTHDDYVKKLANRGESMEDVMKGIIDYEFPKIANQQDKMRSGGYRNKVVSFCIDKGTYTEYDYSEESHMTDKQKAAITKPTRILSKIYNNERFNNDCERAQENTGDQSREYLAQNTARQNTFDDQLGHFTIPPNFEMHAGDTIEVKLSKVESEKDGGYDEKQSGYYAIKGIAHHFMVDQRAYTRISTVRSTTQTDDQSSQ